MKTSVLDLLQTRPLSWSAISSFEFSPDQWYRRYIQNEKDTPSAAMVLGKTVGDRLAADPLYLPQVPRLSEFEYPLPTVFDGIPLIGYIDSYEPHHTLYEYKTGAKAWDQKRADEHGQITAYLLSLWLIHKVKPEQVAVQIVWMPTEETGDFNMQLKNCAPHTFHTKRTMLDLAKFGMRIHKTVKEMQAYVDAQPVDNYPIAQTTCAVN